MDPIFDRRLLRLRRARAAKRFAEAGFLHARVADDLADRLGCVNRRFGRALVLGAPRIFEARIEADPLLREKIGETIGADLSEAMVDLPGVACDPERLPFADAAFDLVVSNLALHWTTDLPGALVLIRRALKPGGLFIGAVLGGETLSELRAVLIEAELEKLGGAAARISPFAQLADLSALLQRAGFADPVADADAVEVRYADPMNLVRDLRAMAETGALAVRPPPLRRDVLSHAMARYRARRGEDGRVGATFEILTATGWAAE